MSSKKTKYKAQALAITMVVLVVSAILGLSIYSRAMKDKLLTVEERASAEALEVADLTLDRLTSKAIDDVVTAISVLGSEADPTANLESGFVLTENNNGKNDITRLFQDSEEYFDTPILGLDQTYSSLLSPICPIDVAGNEYQITLKSAEENYEVRAGHSWSLPAKEILRDKNNCVLDLNVETAGDSKAGFIVSKYYCSYDPTSGIAIDCKEYQVSSNFVEKYCFSDDGIECNDDIRFYDGGGASPWRKYSEGGVLGYSMSFDNTPATEDVLTEIRVTAVSGTVSVGYKLYNPADLTSTECAQGLRMYQLRATANCNGVYRGKEILIPEKGWHDSIFDYVIFNNEGPI